MGQQNSTIRSTTMTVRLECDVDKAFSFLSDLGNWPRWAIVNVLATSKTSNPEWWDMVTPRGAARLRMRADSRHGILDHDFQDAQASWTVPARVIPNGTGAEFLITFFQPPTFSDGFFDEQIKLVDLELAKLKEFSKHNAVARGQSSPVLAKSNEADCPRFAISGPWAVFSSPPAGAKEKSELIHDHRRDVATFFCCSAFPWFDRSNYMDH